MKNIKRLVAILRALGVTLLFIALAVTIYIFATSGPIWNEMKTVLTGAGADAGIGTRMVFHTDMYDALNDAMEASDEADNVKNRLIAEHFAPYLEDAKVAEVDKRAAEVEATYAYFQNEFDANAFLERYALRSSGQEEKDLVAVFEKLDTMLAPASKSGKKLPAAAAKSCRAEVEEFYAAFVEANGEDVGSLLEFANTVVAMVQSAVDNGSAYTKVMDYLNGDEFTFEAYMEVMPTVDSAAGTDNQENMLDSFAALIEKKAAGEAVDFKAFFEETYAVLVGLNPNEALPAYEIYVPCARGLIESIAFDGTYTSVYNGLKEAEASAKATGCEAAIGNVYAKVIEEVKESKDLSAFSLLWSLCSSYGWVWLIGVALIVLAKIADIGLSRALINRRERRKIENDPEVLLKVDHLKQYFRSGDFVNKAVDDVSFYVKKGEVFGLVGESGCGKTTTGRTIINLYDPTDGDVYFQGLRISSNQNGLPVLIRQLKKDYEVQISALEKEYANGNKAELAAKKKELKKKLSDSIEQAQISALESSVDKSRSIKAYREMRKAQLTAEYEKEIKSLSGEAAAERTKRYKQDLKVASKDNIMTKMQMIFQDPIASINPRMTVREIIAEGLIIRGITDKKYIDEKVNEMLELVGLVREHADRYPHEFSGGQRQRIGIARAIVLQPDLIIADEPISALDVSIQAQVINLLNDLRNRMGLTIMFIAHNLSVVKYFSDRIAVMYFGKIVEMTTSDELFAHPLHPYTKSLLSAIPYPDPHYEKQRKRIEYNPTLTHDYSVDKPTMREITPGHFIYCNDAEEAMYKKELGI